MFSTNYMSFSEISGAFLQSIEFFLKILEKLTVGTAAAVTFTRGKITLSGPQQSPQTLFAFFCKNSMTQTLGLEDENIF